MSKKLTTTEEVTTAEVTAIEQDFSISQTGY
jgi:hypothetical protein